MGFQSCERFAAGLQRIPHSQRFGHERGRLIALRAEFIERGPERGDLAFVGPPEHPLARIVHTMAVILVVTLTGAHLTFARDGSPFVPELLEGRGAAVIGTLP